MDRVTRSEGILLSGFENLDSAGQKRKWDELRALVSQRKGPLRVDREVFDDGATALIYIRERTLGEFLVEKIFFALMAPEQLVERENDALASIAHAFGTSFDKTMQTPEASRAATSHPSARGGMRGEMDANLQSAGKCRPDNDATGAVEERVRGDWLQFRQIQDAVLERSPSSLPAAGAIPAMQAAGPPSDLELMPMQGLRRCPPGMSVVPFSPLTLSCDCVLVCNGLSKSSSYDNGEAFVGMKKAYENALRQCTPDLEELHLTSVEGLQHVKHLWLIPDFAQWDERERDQHDMDDWMDFYLDLFMKAAKTSPYGSTVLEPWPSYWTTEGGVSKPVWTDANVQGLAAAALKARHGCLRSQPMFLSVTLAITDAELRERVERELMKQENGLLAAS